MSLDSQESIQYQPKIIAEELNANDYNDLTSKLENFQFLRSGHWLETTDDNAVMNQSADPCLVIYAFLPGNKFISGHFVNHSRLEDESLEKDRRPYTRFLANQQSARTEKGVFIPTGEYKQHMDDEEYMVNQRKQYLEMLRRIKEIMKDSNNVKDPQIFLFGQRYEKPDVYRITKETIIPTIETAIDRNDASFDITQAGIPLSGISDLRYPNIRKPGMDYTFFHPGQRKVFYSRS